MFSTTRSKMHVNTSMGQCESVGSGEDCVKVPTTSGAGVTQSQVTTRNVSTRLMYLLLSHIRTDFHHHPPPQFKLTDIKNTVCVKSNTDAGSHSQCPGQWVSRAFFLCCPLFPRADKHKYPPRGRDENPKGYQHVVRKSGACESMH